MKEHGELINLIDLGKTVPNKIRNEMTIESRKKLNENLVSNSEKSALFNEIHLVDQMDCVDEQNHFNNQNDAQSNTFQNHQDLNSQDLNYLELNAQIKTKKSLLRSKFKNLSANNPVLSSRNNYEKLTDSLLINLDNNKYYGSFSKAKIDETAFNNMVTSINDDQSITASINSQNLVNIYLKEFEQEKHLNLLGFKTILIIILSFCFLISLIYTFKVYNDLTDKKLVRIDLKEHTQNYWRITWIINSVVTLIILLIGIIGLLKEKVILILITSVCMMFSLMESDDPIDGKKIFNISLMVILSTSVLLIVFAARLRCYAEEKLNLVNKIQYMGYMEF